MSTVGVLVSCLAGLSTSIGALPVFMIRGLSPRLYASGLTFSAGVLLYVSFVEIFQEGFNEVAASLLKDETNDEDYQKSLAYAYCCLAYFTGYALSTVFDKLIHIFVQYRYLERETPKEVYRKNIEQENRAGFRDRKGVKKMGRMGKKCWFGTVAALSCSRSNIDLEPTTEEMEAFEEQTGHYLRVGLTTSLALILHNFPEGIATYSGFLTDPQLGYGLATAIGIHNIPEGFSVAMPVYLGTGSKWQAFTIATLSGLAETLASIIAYFTIDENSINPFYFGLLYCSLAGLMVRVAVSELLTTAVRFDRRMHYIGGSLLIGMIVMALSLVSFQLAYMDVDEEFDPGSLKHIGLAAKKHWLVKGGI